MCIIHWIFAWNPTHKPQRPSYGGRHEDTKSINVAQYQVSKCVWLSDDDTGKKALFANKIETKNHHHESTS